MAQTLQCLVEISAISVVADFDIALQLTGKSIQLAGQDEAAGTKGIPIVAAFLWLRV